MHKIILMMLLSVMSSSAMAGWVLFHKDSDTTVYVDWAGLKKSKNIVTVNILEDYKEPASFMGAFIYNSATLPRRIDCKNFKLKSLEVTFYAENMGVNRVSGQEESPGWEDAPKEGDWLLDVAKKACQKSK